MKIIRSAVMASQVFMLLGCGNVVATRDDDRQVYTSPTQEAPSENFAHHLADAGKFWDLNHLGDAYRKQGKYEAALDAYNQALEKHAYSRPEQSIALEHMAMTYEAMGDLKQAAVHYELSAATTMSNKNAKELKSKALALRQKLSTQPSV